MNAMAKPLPYFEIQESEVRRCTQCGDPISWQTSHKTGTKYPTDVWARNGTSVTRRNAFHRCKRLQAEQAGQQSFIPGPKATDLSGVYKLFEHAISQQLKWPKIRLQTLAGQPVVLSVAGQRSKYMGQIMVTDGKPYGFNQYFGRIDKQGNFLQAQATPEVLQLLDQLGKDPVAVAQQYGKLTGNCCFCGRRLEDERSTQVGYGPICAGKWSLPWG